MKTFKEAAGEIQDKLRELEVLNAHNFNDFRRLLVMATSPLKEQLTLTIGEIVELQSIEDALSNIECFMKILIKQRIDSLEYLIKENN